MNTSMQNLQEVIAHLEKTRPGNPLVDDLKKQLAGWQAAGTKTAQELYFSGRSMASQNHLPTDSAPPDPMQPAIDALERTMNDLAADKPAKPPLK